MLKTTCLQERRTHGHQVPLFTDRALSGPQPMPGWAEPERTLSGPGSLLCSAHTTLPIKLDPKTPRGERPYALCPSVQKAIKQEAAGLGICMCTGLQCDKLVAT